MAIDDPISKELDFLEEQLDEESSFPRLAARFGLSATTVVALQAHPIISQILTSLLTVSQKRFEKRFVSVMRSLAAQQKRIEDKIPDRIYYQSEEFHACLLLILERLHVTYQEEKLKIFGEALANSGTTEFAADDKEIYIRILRDLSLEDLHTLRKMKEIDQRRGIVGTGRVRKGDTPSFARLASLGLLQESTDLMKFDLRIPVTPRSTQTPEGYARGMAKALEQYIKDAAITTYRISGFGQKFLLFVASAKQE